MHIHSMRIMLTVSAILMIAAGAYGEHKHAEVERMTHDYVYRAPTSKTVQNTLKSKAGMTIVSSIVDKESGFTAMVIEKKGKHFIVFRGTDELTVDTFDYVHNAEAQVGRTQYQKHKDTLAAWAKQYKPATVSGHSLGGAIAQRFVADNPSTTKEMVLFQSPGVEHEVRDKLKDYKGVPPKCSLYVAEHDIVADAGYQHLLEPDVVCAKVGDLGTDLDSKAASHMAFLLQSNSTKSIFAEGSAKSSYAVA